MTDHDQVPRRLVTCDAPDVPLRVVLLASATSAHTRRWAGDLAMRGHEVTVCSWHQPEVGPDGWHASSASTGACLPLRLVRAGHWLRHEVRRTQPDVIHVHSLGTHGILSLLLPAHPAVPLVITPWGSELRAADRHAGRALVARLALRRASRVVPTSREVAELVRNRYGVPGPRITVLSWGVPDVLLDAGNDVSSARRPRTWDTMGHDESGVGQDGKVRDVTSPSAAGGAARPDLRPDPETVTSVSELGYQLRLLRLAAGAPTLRRMEAWAAEGGTSLPRSTISNAMSGRHLPALSTVLAFVSVCGCPAHEISRWRAAWQRAYADRYMHSSDPVRSAPHVTAAPPGDGGAEAADEVDAEATDGVLAARIASLPLVQSAERLTALGPHRAAAILTALGAGPASARMALMPHEQTRTILVVMTPDLAAECMARWNEERVLSLVSDMAEDAAAARMTELPQATAAGLLIRMTASKRNTILTFLAPHLVSRLLAELSDDDALELLRTMDVRMAARVWSDRLLRLLLACADTAWAVDVLNAKDPGSLFPMLERATDEERFATFRMVDPEQRGELIRFIEPDEPRYWGWMKAIGKDSVTEAIEALEPAHAADVLALARQTWGPSFPDPRQ